MRGSELDGLIDTGLHGRTSQPATLGPFLLRGERPVHAPVLGARLQPCTLDALAGVAQAHLDRAEGIPMLVGAIPYDRAGETALWQPAARDEAMPATRATVAPCRWTVRAEPTVAAYRAAVAEAVGRFGPALQKTVLSRSLRLSGGGPIDPAALLAALSSDPSVAAFSTPLPALDGQPRRLIGATPELLVSRRGLQVCSRPLAGSARRDGGRAAGAALMNHDKDRREHALVVEAVADALAPFCVRLSVPQTPSLYATATMWHLGTEIAGDLRDDIPVTTLLAALHPTPAVCGLPRVPADRLLRELEGYDRGYYAGAIGWADRAGDGEWYVALRCAELAGADLRLFAGAGIVAGSMPEAEAAETSAKFQAMLQALGIDEDGNPKERSEG